MKEIFHFDPITIVLVIGAVIGNWKLLGERSKGHSDWIKKHDKECDEQRKANSDILAALRETNAHLATMVQGHHERIMRLESQQDRAMAARI